MSDQHDERETPVLPVWRRIPVGSERHRLVEVDGRRLRLTNLRKVLYPEAVTWADLAAAVDAGSVGALLTGPEEALDRVAQTGDLFAPVLSFAQRLP